MKLRLTFLVLFVEKFNKFPHSLDRVNVDKFAIISSDDELQYYGAKEGLTWLGNVCTANG